MTNEEIKQASMRATLCLEMVSVHFKINGESCAAYFMPWNCLEKAAELFAAGATSIALHHSSVTREFWSWRADPSVKRRRTRKVA